MKKKRQKKILEIIASHDVETQDELLRLLEAEGFHTTQATISRDIRELKLRKEVRDGRRQVYTADTSAVVLNTDSYKQVLSTGILTMEAAENLIVIKTVSGVAMAVGAALDHMNIKGLIGCIAGDDTIFLAVKTSAMTGYVMSEIRKAAYPER